MVNVVVWSEREQNPQAPGWHDCWVSGALMTLVYGGFARFPLGLYADAEREALERSQTIVRPESGGNNVATLAAVNKRYGVTFKHLTDRSATSLALALGHVGWGMSLAGMNSRFPAGARVWDAAYQGAHQVCVIPLGGGKLRWLDPEAPMGYAGDIINASEVLNWAILPSDPLILAADELASPFDLAGQISLLGTQYPSYVHSEADAFTWTIRALKGAGLLRSGVVISGNLAGRLSPLGTKYPSYVHSGAQALAWMSRAIGTVPLADWIRSHR